MKKVNKNESSSSLFFDQRKKLTRTGSAEVEPSSKQSFRPTSAAVFMGNRKREGQSVGAGGLKNTRSQRHLLQSASKKLLPYLKDQVS